MQFKFNLFPCYRRTGAKVVYVADDFREVHIHLPLNWKTRGYFGTTFGGSMYGAVDPVYMVMLNVLLGPQYRVWDKEAKIEFLRPGRSTLEARFVVLKSDTDAIVEALGAGSKMDKTYYVDLTSPAGEIHAHFEKILHIHRREHKNQ